MARRWPTQKAEVKMRAKAWGEVARLLKDSDVVLDRLISPSWALYSSLSVRKRVEPLKIKKRK